MRTGSWSSVCVQLSSEQREQLRAVVQFGFLNDAVEQSIQNLAELGARLESERFEIRSIDCKTTSCDDGMYWMTMCAMRQRVLQDPPACRKFRPPPPHCETQSEQIVHEVRTDLPQPAANHRPAGIWRKQNGTWSATSALTRSTSAFEAFNRRMTSSARRAPCTWPFPVNRQQPHRTRARTAYRGRAAVRQRAAARRGVMESIARRLSAHTSGMPFAALSWSRPPTILQLGVKQQAKRA